MKLATKISSGFAALLIIALALGILAAVAMRQSSERANVLRDKQAPAVRVASQVEREALLTMYNVRGWSLNGNPEWKRLADEHYDRLSAALTAAATLASEQQLPNLAAAASAAQTAANEYDRLYKKTVAQEEVIANAVKDRAAAAVKFMDQAYKYLKSQQESIVAEVAAGAEAAKVTERMEKINGIHDVIDMGNALRLAAWRAQAEFDPRIFTTRLADLDAIAIRIAAMLVTTRVQANRDELAQIADAAKAYRAAGERWVNAEESVATIAGERTAKARDILEAAQSTAEFNIKATSDAAAASATGLEGATTALLWGLAIACVTGISLAFGITLSITKPVNRIVDQLSAGADQTASAAAQVSQSSQSMASGASQQAASLEETGASLEEMTAMVRSAADNAGKTDTITSKAKGDFDRGLKAMTDLSTAMKEIKDSADKTAKIVKTIDEIAFQTNLLALNAAVEAARAGDAGKGFAVVAEEVRNLAQRAGEAARNTAALIEGSVKSAESGVVLCRNTGEIMTELAGGTRTIAELVGQIATGSKEQSQGIDQINKAVAQMDQVTQGSAANAEEGAATAEELSAQAESIRGLVNELEILVRGAAAQQQHAKPHAPTLTPRTLTPAKTTMGQRTTNTAHGGGDAANLGKF